MRIKNKPISFNEGEEKLLNWVEKQDKPFASYVKDLIREDMRKNKQISKDELKNMIKEVMTDMDFEFKTPAVKNETTLGHKSKAAYKNIMNNHKK